MFGFCRPPKQDLEYRSVYSRCCQFQRLHYGVTATTFTSYDMALLFAIAMDANPSIKAALPQQYCCRLRKLRRSTAPHPDAAIGKFVSSLGMVMVGVKLADDIRDEGSWRARLANWWFTKPIRTAGKYFESLDPSFASTLDAQINEHLAMEVRQSPCRIAEYAVPTADAFSYAFGLMGRLSEMTGLTGFLKQLGRLIGTAIIAFDCAADWERDKKNGQFNPLGMEHDVAEAIQLCHDSLAQASQLCRDQFGEGGLGYRILTEIAQVIRTPAANGGLHCSIPQETLEMLGLTARRRYVYTGACAECQGSGGALAICCVASYCWCKSCCKSGCYDNTVYVEKEKSC